MIAVVDMGLGNINSVARALTFIDAPYELVSEPSEKMYDKIIFPGVGSFSEASMRLIKSGMKAWIRKNVLSNNLPFLGICLGMQLMADTGEEGGKSEGLGLIRGNVSKLNPLDKSLPLPHVGWNDVDFTDMNMMNEIKKGTCFYFVHSYHLIPAEPLHVALSNYGGDFVAAVEKGNIWGAQFHPEKSQTHGIKLLTNFAKGIFNVTA